MSTVHPLVSSFDNSIHSNITQGTIGRMVTEDKEFNEIVHVQSKLRNSLENHAVKELTN